MIGVTLGTGLGAGFIEEGRVVHDQLGVPPGGELWNVPFRDSVAEDYSNGAALRRLARQRLGVPVSARELAGDPSREAALVFERFGGQLAEVLAPWTASFQAERVVLGGNVSRAFGRFGEALQAGLPAGCRACQSVHFEDAALLGAAQLTPWEPRPGRRP